MKAVEWRELAERGTRGDMVYDLIRDLETAEHTLEEHSTAKTKHGGARPGSGPKPRTDGRRLRIVKVALNDSEHAAILVKASPSMTKNTDARREALLGYGVAKLAIIKALSALETNPVTGMESAWTILKVAMDRLSGL